MYAEVGLTVDEEERDEPKTRNDGLLLRLSVIKLTGVELEASMV